MNVCYTLPTQEMSDLITKSKLDRIIDNNPAFRSQVSGNLRTKKVGERMMYLMYTYGAANAISFSTDYHIYDEVSRSNESTIDMLKSRLLSSSYQYEHFVSNPSVPDDLMHRTFKKSDQKHWAIKHEADGAGCGKWQILNFEENVNRDLKMFVCSHCGKPLSISDRVNGEWVKKFEGKDISGYWIHQLMRHNATVPELLYEEDKNMATFYNMFLGLPYAGTNVTVSKALIKSHLIKPYITDENVVMGVDVGGSEKSSGGHHYCIGNDDYVWKMGKAKDFDEIRALIRQYKVQKVIIDNAPEWESVQKLIAEFPQIVMRCVYVGNKADKLITYVEPDYKVQVARHIYFDKIINDLVKGVYKFAFVENDPMLNDFAEQFSHMGCSVSKDNQGNPSLVWEAPNNSADHFAHAFLYYTVALERLRSFSQHYMPYVPAEGRKSNPSQDSDIFIPGGNQNELNWYDY